MVNRGATRLPRILIGILVVLAGIITPLAIGGPAWAETNSCGVSIQNPHSSSGAGGIIVKGTWTCADVPTIIYIYPNGFNLWLCTDKAPQKSETYLATDPHCWIKASNENDINITRANTGYTIYSPDLGTSGVHGSGWWVACAVWHSGGPKGTGGTITSFSNVVKLTG